MSTDSKEHLSELMDGEIGGDTGRFVLRRLEASEELRGAWARYHLIRDCMRYQDRGLAGDKLAARVRLVIEGSDESVAHSSPAANRHWLRPVSGFAVAAAVALMAVIAVAPNLPNATGIAAEEATAQQAQPFTSPNILSRAPASRPVNLNGKVNVSTGDTADRMNSYLLRHYQVAGSSGGNGFVSFVPIVVSKSAVRQSDRAAEVAQPSEQAVTERDSNSDSQ